MEAKIPTHGSPNMPLIQDIGPPGTKPHTKGLAMMKMVDPPMTEVVAPPTRPRSLQRSCLRKRANRMIINPYKDELAKLKAEVEGTTLTPVVSRGPKPCLYKESNKKM